MSRYQFIAQVAAEPVQVLCRVLQVSAAGYYQWLSRAARPTPAWEPAETTPLYQPRASVSSKRR